MEGADQRKLGLPEERDSFGVNESGAEGDEREEARREKKKERERERESVRAVSRAKLARIQFLHGRVRERSLFQGILEYRGASTVFGLRVGGPYHPKASHN